MLYTTARTANRHHSRALAQPPRGLNCRYLACSVCRLSEVTKSRQSQYCLWFTRTEKALMSASTATTGRAVCSSVHAAAKNSRHRSCVEASSVGALQDAEKRRHASSWLRGASPIFIIDENARRSVLVSCGLAEHHGNAFAVAWRAATVEGRRCSALRRSMCN